MLKIHKAFRHAKQNGGKFIHICLMNAFFDLNIFPLKNEKKNSNTQSKITPRTLFCGNFFRNGVYNF